MHALITGARGTVGTVLRTHLYAQGHTTTAWDRQAVPLDDYAAMERYAADCAPDVLFHLAVASQPTGRANEGWLVNEHWPSELAWITRQQGIRFVFTSTVMVYTDAAGGPYTPHSVPDATDGYGAQKLRTEQRVQHQNPDVVIARLGWQIGTTPEGNHMVAHLHREQQEHGCIEASTAWLPACSFLSDTAATLTQLATTSPGVYLLDANDGWSYYQIVSALNTDRGTPWTVLPTDAFVYDQRMQDDRINVASLRHRLPTLPRL